MKQICLVVATFLLAFGAQAHSDMDHDGKASVQVEKGAKKFGAPILDKETLSLTGITQNFDKYQDKTVTFDATVKKVCKSKGCWMTLQDGSTQVRTLFKDYGFFVPKEILDQKVRVSGKMSRKKVSAATLRHYLKDEGAKLAEIKKIKTGQWTFEFVADGVEIL